VSTQVTIAINGKTRDVQPRQTLLGLLRELDLDPARVAVELNRKIVHRPAWETTEIPPDAQIEIVQFVGGG
jgi:thiamine biosynthesis protein ThiS